MTNISTMKQQVGQQLQVANQQITLCQEKIQSVNNSPDMQLYLQNALGAISKAWEIVESNT
ncbi:MAG TPA: hypothetical protein VHP38_04725 [Ruminiclostridium sp.]|nr:hypothetical protein [Ruminiclostridium sp.]